MNSLSNEEEIEKVADSLDKAIERMPDEIRYLNSEASDIELAYALHKLFQWGVSTGRLLGEKKITCIDERQWEMVQNTFDKFASSFANRAGIQSIKQEKTE